MTDGRVIGAEALARWDHPSEVLIYPDNFIPLVERTGLINNLTLTVLDAALAQARILARSRQADKCRGQLVAPFAA